MIRGRTNRRQARSHFRRILRPGGQFVLHVHNFWFNLRDPQGPSWLIKKLVAASLQQDIEIGDKWFPYRGVPHMFLHVFHRRERMTDLGQAGFEIVEVIPLDVARRHRLRWPWLFGAIRTNG